MVTSITAGSQAYANEGLDDSVFKEVRPEAFLLQLMRLKNIDFDVGIVSGDKGISSLNMNDGITIFGIQKNEFGSKKIIGLHLQNIQIVTEENIRYYFEDANATSTDIYLIGGSSESIRNGLVDTIKQKLNQVLGEKFKIVEEKLNILRNRYISASLNTKGEFTFCRHRQRINIYGGE